MKSAFIKNRDEILYKLINSFLGGALVFLGAFSSGDITREGLVISVVAFLSILVTQFKDYWATQEKEYKARPMHLFKFV